MPKIILFSFRASREIDRYALEYELKKVGLGDRFVANVQKLTQLIANQPYLYAKHKRNLRIAKVHRFPFNLFYVVRRHFVEIAAIMPSRTNPVTWPLKP